MQYTFQHDRLPEKTVNQVDHLLTTDTMQNTWQNEQTKVNKVLLVRHKHIVDIVGSVVVLYAAQNSSDIIFLLSLS